MKTKIFLGLLGLLLLTGMLLTRNTELSERDRKIYEQALSLEGNLDTSFDDFRFSEIPVRIFDGDADHVRVNGRFVREKPVLRVLAATALEVDGAYTLLTPSVDLMEDMLGLLSSHADSYTDNQHAAVLWHEAFHAYQFTHYETAIARLPDAHAEDSIFSEADAHPQAKQLYLSGLKALHAAAFSEDPAVIQKEAAAYLQLTSKRDRLLSDPVRAAERRMETIEGTAYYIEMRAADALGTDTTSYVDLPLAYANGSSKYYNSGMLIWKVLIKLDPEQMRDYDFSVPIRDVLEEMIKE